ncbi:MAG TPA: hypothetical protein DHV26_10395 [Cytophagales bacterium]|nr:hypothetical protein [Cytophagales bacterium]
MKKRKKTLGKYVIEFFIIFFSITLSFIVEEWRVKRQESRQTRDFLVRLKTELQARSKATTAYFENNEILMGGYQRIAENFSTREISNDSLYRILTESEHSSRFDPDIATWTSLTNSGIISTVKPAIIDSVNALLTVYKELNRTNDYLYSLTFTSWQKFIPDFPSETIIQQWTDLFQQKLKQDLKMGIHVQNQKFDPDKFLNNPIAIDYFFFKLLMTKGTQEMYRDEVMHKEKRLLELIEKEIKD